MSTLLRSSKVAVDDPSRERGASTKKEGLQSLSSRTPQSHLFHYLIGGFSVVLTINRLSNKGVVVGEALCNLNKATLLHKQPKMERAFKGQGG